MNRILQNLKTILLDTKRLIAKYYPYILLVSFFNVLVGLFSSRFFYVPEEELFHLNYLYAGILLILSTTFIYSVFALYVNNREQRKKTTLVESSKDVLPKLLILSAALLLYVFYMLLGFLALIIPGIILMIWFSQVTYLMLLENRGLKESFALSRKMTKGYRITIFIIIILTIMLSAPFSFFIKNPTIIELMTNLLSGLDAVIAFALWRFLRKKNSSLLKKTD